MLIAIVYLKTMAIDWILYNTQCAQSVVWLLPSNIYGGSLFVIGHFAFCAPSSLWLPTKILGKRKKHHHNNDIS